MLSPKKDRRTYTFWRGKSRNTVLQAS